MRRDSLVMENRSNYLNFIKAIIDIMPYPVFIKDEFRNYFMINPMEASLFDLPEREILGKSDEFFIKNLDELSVIVSSDNEVLFHNKSIELPNQTFTLNGKTHVFRTHKQPIINPFTGEVNILGFSADVTDEVQLDKLKKVITMCSNPFML